MAFDIRPPFAFVVLVLTTACGGPHIGSQRANQYFAEHGAALSRVAAQVEYCQPESGRIDQASTFQCVSPRGDPNELKSATRAANARWIRTFYTNEGSEERSLGSVHIALRSEGMAFAGVIEEFIYEAMPAPRAEYEREDDGIAVVERQPVTGPPHHWYWRKIAR